MYKNKDNCFCQRNDLDYIDSEPIKLTTNSLIHFLTKNINKRILSCGFIKMYFQTQPSFLLLMFINPFIINYINQKIIYL